MFPYPLSFTIGFVVMMMYNKFTSSSFSVASTNALRGVWVCGICEFCRVALKAPTGDLSTSYRFIFEEFGDNTACNAPPLNAVPRIQLEVPIQFHFLFKF